MAPGETLRALACPDITEDSLLAGAALPLAPPHLPWGKGTDQLPHEVHLCPKQRQDTGGPLTCPLTCMKAAQDPLGNVLRWLKRPARGVGAAPSGVRHAWTALRRRLEGLRALGLEYTDLELGGTHDRLAPLESLSRFHTTLAGRLRATLWAEDQGHLREWRVWLQVTWTSDQGAVYRWLKDDIYAPPVTFLSRPEGTATSNPVEMDGLLQDA